MSIRDWPARKLGHLWLLGLGLQVGIMGAWAAYGRLSETPEQRELRRQGDALRRRTDSVHAVMLAEDDSIRRGLRPPRPMLSPAQQAEFRRLLRDSMGISWETQGAVTTVHLPPPLAEATGRAVTNIGDALRAALLLMALLLLPIPTTLLLVTAAWLVLRRPWRRPVAPEEAA